MVFRPPLPRVTQFTFTAEGNVPHASVVTPHGAIFLPVMLQPDPLKPGQLRRNIHGQPFPRKVGSRFVYALPGGGEVVQ